MSHFGKLFKWVETTNQQQYISGLISVEIHWILVFHIPYRSTIWVLTSYQLGYSPTYRGYNPIYNWYGPTL